MDIQEGAVVRHRGWGGRFVGMVTRRDGDAVFVAWYGTAVEDELRADELELVPNPPPDLAAWRGGIGVIDAGGDWHVQPCEDQR